MKKLLGIVAVGAIAFGVVTSAAASLGTVSTNQVVPQQSTSASLTGGCASAASVGWTYDSASNPTAISKYTVTLTANSADACDGVKVNLSADGTAGTIAGQQTIPSSSGSSPAIDFTVTGSPTIANFAPGAFTVTLSK